jgi:flagellar motor switch protein FliG
MTQALAQIKPMQVAAPASVSARPRAVSLNRRQKAAIIVRILLAEGSPLPLGTLPDGMQADLAQQMGDMRLVDRATLEQVVSEFLDELGQVGLTFPGGLAGAINLMEGHISDATATHLRRMMRMRGDSDPWDRISVAPVEALLPHVAAESAEVAAVLLSKLPPSSAAGLLSKLPGDHARRIAHSMSRTRDIAPATVQRIGIALLNQLDSTPPRAFENGPAERVGAILNVATEGMRADVLDGLSEADAAFAAEVRKSIFTFAHIPLRVEPRDVPRILRVVDQPTLVVALAAANTDPARSATAEFLLANLSQRMAQSLRDEITDRGAVKAAEGDAAMAAVVSAIRALEAAGELVLAPPETET